MTATPNARPTALTIAGTDSSGGAGVVADVRTFAAFDVWPLCAVTAVTAQTVDAVIRVTALDPIDVVAQIDAVADGIGIDAAKTGMLPNAACVDAVAAAIARADVALVVDPVLRATSGAELAAADVADATVRRLFPLATLVTPNLVEAGALLGGDPPASASAMAEAARALLELGVGAALVTGGHLEAGDVAADVLVIRGAEPQWMVAPRVATTWNHGTGCVLSAAITAGLACGAPLEQAVGDAKAFVTDALRHAVRFGHGGAVDPHPRL
jgi:hydroxymethylpyrimidine/phosphomethylpyrimidine kinase